MSTPEERIKELEDALTQVQIKFTEKMLEAAKLSEELGRTNSALSTEKFRVKQLRDGLKFYAPGPFWTDVVPDTKAAVDLGKYAEYILRVTAGVDDVEGS